MNSTPTAPAWRVAADAHTAIEFARMAQMEIIDARETPTTVDVCDYVTSAVHAFEAKYRAVAWNEDGAPDWTEATETFWQQYTAAHAPPWIDDVEEARAECAAEALTRWLVARYVLDAVHYGEGHIEIRFRMGGTYAYVDVQDDGTCTVAYYENRVTPVDLAENVPVDEHDQIVAAINAAHARAMGGA